MGLKGPILAGEARAQAFSVDVRRERACQVHAGPETQPHDSDGAAPPERTDVAKPELERTQRLGGKRRGDRLDYRSVDVADEAHGEVEVGRRRPAKFGSHPRTLREEARQLFTLRFGHRQPEERADPQRAPVFFQCS